MFHVIWVQGIFVFWGNFNLWRSLLMVALYHQTKTPISFWCSRELNLRSLIQPSDTLPIELTRTHEYKAIWYCKFFARLKCMKLCTLDHECLSFFFFFFWMNILERVVSDIFTSIIYTKMDVEGNVNSLVPNTPRI